MSATTSPAPMNIHPIFFSQRDGADPTQAFGCYGRYPSPQWHAYAQQLAQQHAQPHTFIFPVTSNEEAVPVFDQFAKHFHSMVLHTEFGHDDVYDQDFCAIACRTDEQCATLKQSALSAMRLYGLILPPQTLIEKNIRRAYRRQAIPYLSDDLTCEHRLSPQPRQRDRIIAEAITSLLQHLPELSETQNDALHTALSAGDTPVLFALIATFYRDLSPMTSKQQHDALIIANAETCVLSLAPLRSDGFCNSGMSCVGLVARIHEPLACNVRLSFQDHIYHETLDIIKTENKGQAWKTLDPNDGTPCCIFAEFIHNTDEVDVHPQEQLTQDAIAWVQKSKSSHSVFAIDITMSDPEGESVAQLIRELAPSIATGRVSLILYRSWQKFDQLGMDVANGGSLTTYSHHTTMHEFFSKNRNSSVLSKAFLPALHQWAHSQLQQYRHLLYASAHKLVQSYQTLTHDQPTPLTLSFTPGMPFASIRIQAGSRSNNEPKSPLSQSIYFFMSRLGRDLGLTTGASFGFSTPHLTCIKQQIVRLSVGCLDDDEILTWANFLSDINHVLNTAESIKGHDNVYTSFINVLSPRTAFTAHDLALLRHGGKSQKARITQRIKHSLQTEHDEQ